MIYFYLLFNDFFFKLTFFFIYFFKSKVKKTYFPFSNQMYDYKVNNL